MSGEEETQREGQTSRLWEQRLLARTNHIVRLRLYLALIVCNLLLRSPTKLWTLAAQTVSRPNSAGVTTISPREVLCVPASGAVSFESIGRESVKC